MTILSIIRKAIKTLGWILKAESNYDQQLIIIAQSLIEKQRDNALVNSLSEVEFKVFSQWGDDGIIQWLINNLEIENKTFIEFGVENYKESNTRFLLMNNNWSGLVIDGSEKNVAQIRNSYYYWKYDITALTAFVDAENINQILSQSFNGKIGLLHIDIDGNDYWVWKAINCVSPDIVIVEYNSVFGIHRPITIPYQPEFKRTDAHPSWLYYGSSLMALTMLAEEKGFSFIGCNSAGNNAYFIKKSLLNYKVKEVSVEKGFVVSKFRESRAKGNKLSYIGGQDRYQLIKGLPVYNIETNSIEPL